MTEGLLPASVTAEWVDYQVLDMIPVVSTVTNGIILIAKAVFACCYKPEQGENRFFVHIRDKSVWRCLTLLVPGFGQLAIIAYDCCHKSAPIRPIEPTQKNEKMEGLEGKIRILQGLYLALPQPQTGDPLNSWWGESKQALLRFTAISDQIENIDLENEQWSAKIKEFNELRTLLMEARRGHYANFLESLSPTALLVEAKERYLESYRPFPVTVNVTDKNCREMLVLLKARCFGLKDCEKIELEELGKLLAGIDS